MRVCERPLVNITNEVGYFQFEYLTNSLWFTASTLTTAGYGDLYPRTQLGRITCMYLAMWGVILLSVMVVVMNNTFDMEPSN
jgi:voltage-gated potassium channel Kch